MKLACIIPCLNQFAITQKTLEFLSQQTPRPYELIVLDNGSTEEFKTTLPDVKVIHYEEPIGSYVVFAEALKQTDADIIAVFHSDMFIYDSKWHTKVIECFEKDSTLGLIGFIGSNMIDSSGGFGIGKWSNFQGNVIEQKVEDNESIVWKGSHATMHGGQISDFRYGAVIDGCSMIVRRTALEQLEVKKDFPIMHFYDRLICSQILEAKWKIGILGIACDHISGQTMGESTYIDACKKWAINRHLNPGGMGIDWNEVIYKEAERQWLTEYRDEKHLVPIRINYNTGIKI